MVDDEVEGHVAVGLLHGNGLLTVGMQAESGVAGAVERHARVDDLLGVGHLGAIELEERCMVLVGGDHERSVGRADEVVAGPRGGQAEGEENC